MTVAQNAQVGDVFTIAIDSSRCGIGQVAGAWNGELYLVLYDLVYSNGDIDPNDVLAATPLFSALSLDAKLYRGDWKVIGNIRENVTRLPQPVFKITQGQVVFLESRDRSVSRAASDEEAQALKFRTVVAPIRLENALKAYNGIGEWNPRYDDLRADYAAESSRFLDQSNSDHVWALELLTKRIKVR